MDKQEAKQTMILKHMILRSLLGWDKVVDHKSVFSFLDFFDDLHIGIVMKVSDRIIKGILRGFDRHSNYNGVGDNLAQLA